LAECGDRDRQWFPQRRVCLPELERAVAERLYEQLHKEQPFHDGTFSRWSKEPSAETPAHFLDGVSIWVAERDLNPGDLFTTEETATPWPSDEGPVGGELAADLDEPEQDE
jgi:hypothetical protein